MKDIMRYEWLGRLWRRRRTRVENYPSNCIKGIPLDTDVKGMHVGSHVFLFDPKHARGDGWIEQSINWEDDHNACEFTLNQKKEDGGLQFRGGIAILPRESIDQFNKLPAIKGLLSYERSRLKHNRYHGNLLLKDNVEKPARRSIAGTLAVHVAEIISQK